VGRAFHKLYQPITPFKDELNMLIPIPKNNNRKEHKIRHLEEENIALKEEIKQLRERINRADG